MEREGHLTSARQTFDRTQPIRFDRIAQPHAYKYWLDGWNHIRGLPRAMRGNMTRTFRIATVWHHFQPRSGIKWKKSSPTSSIPSAMALAALGRGVERTLTSLFGSSNARYLKKATAAGRRHQRLGAEVPGDDRRRAAGADRQVPQAAGGRRNARRPAGRGLCRLPRGGTPRRWRCGTTTSS